MVTNNQQKWGWGNWWGNKLDPKIWFHQINNNDTSQHLFDPYSLDHFSFGILQYMLIPPFYWRRKGEKKSCYWFWINFVLHTIWEFFENTPWIISTFRSNGYCDYIGDSIANSFGDMIAFLIGYFFSWYLIDYCININYSIRIMIMSIIFIFVQFIADFFGAGFFATFKNLLCKGNSYPEMNDRICNVK